MTERTSVPSYAQDSDTASEAQRRFITDLLVKRDLNGLTEVQREWLATELEVDKLTKAHASRLLDVLTKLPERPRSEWPNVAKENKEFSNVPAGRYAVDNEEGELRFYIVDRPTEGQWSGFLFLSVLASDERHPIKGKDAKFAILTKIAADPKAAAIRFGKETTHCSICGRRLTRPSSRAAGIGPICAERVGW